MQTGQLEKTLNAHVDAIESLVISPNGKLIISASWDNEIKLWNFKTGQLIHTLKGHHDDIKAIAISPDGDILASGSYDNSINLWNPKNGQLLKHLSEHYHPVWSLAFNSEGTILASASGDETIKLWLMAHPKPQTSLVPQPSVKKAPITITNAEVIKQMNQILYDTIDKRWQSNFMLKDTLIYQVSLNEKGKIIAYKPFNSAAIQEMQKTAHIFQPDAQSPSESFAQFQVVLSPSGLLEVTPWDGWR